MFSVRQWPLWVRYAVAVGTAAIVFAVIVVWVHDHSSQAEGLPAGPNKAQAATLAQEDREVVIQQQAPHTVKLTAGTAPLAAASAAVDGYMQNQVSRGFISGPVDGRASCAAAGGSSGRALFSCEIRAGSKVTRLKYPFRAVVSETARRVTYCQVVTPSYPLKAIPLSAACR